MPYHTRAFDLGSGVTPVPGQVATSVRSANQRRRRMRNHTSRHQSFTGHISIPHRRLWRGWVCSRCLITNDSFVASSRSYARDNPTVTDARPAFKLKQLPASPAGSHSTGLHRVAQTRSLASGQGPRIVDFGWELIFFVRWIFSLVG